MLTFFKNVLEVGKNVHEFHKLFSNYKKVHNFKKMFTHLKIVCNFEKDHEFKNHSWFSKNVYGFIKKLWLWKNNYKEIVKRKENKKKKW